MHQFIQCEIAKCLDTLAQTSPSSEEYCRILGGLHNVYSLIDCLQECVDIVSSDSKPQVIPFPTPEETTVVSVKTEAPTQEELTEIEELNSVEESPTEPTQPAEEITFEILREALVKARMEKGVDASAIIRRYGVNNLTALPKDKYAAVMADLERA